MLTKCRHASCYTTWIAKCSASNEAIYMFTSPSWTGKLKLVLKLSLKLLQKSRWPKVSENTLRRTVTLLFEDLNRWGVLVLTTTPPTQLPCSTNTPKLCSSFPTLCLGMTTTQSENARSCCRPGYCSTERRIESFQDPQDGQEQLKSTHLLFSQIRISRYSFPVLAQHLKCSSERYRCTAGELSKY